MKLKNPHKALFEKSRGRSPGCGGLSHVGGGGGEGAVMAPQ